MVKENTWLNWYCANCGTLVGGTLNQKGRAQATCRKCRFVMVRTIQAEGIDCIMVYRSKK